MEKTRRKSSASEFFSRRHSSSLFQSMRRYSSSTIFGPRPASGSGAGDTKTNGASEKRKGRRHSTTQLHVSSADTASAGGPHDKLKIVANGLGDVDELQEGYGEAVDGSETGRAENDEHMMMNTEHEVSWLSVLYRDVGACLRNDDDTFSKPSPG